MFILDSLLVGGLRFVFDKVATLADQELNDPARQRERLLDAELRLESGEIGQAEFDAIEADVFAQIRRIKDAQPVDTVVDNEHRIAGVEISVDDKVS